MREIQWQLKETFAFPQVAGKPIGADLVRVTPRYAVERSEDSVKLTGIYHIAANVVLEQDEVVEKDIESAILINDIEVETGYFEYAAPFNIDLPPEANDPLKMKTLNAKHEIDKEGNFAIIWDVQCSYKEVVVIMDQESEADAKKSTNQSEMKESTVAVEINSTSEAINNRQQEAMENAVAIHESTSFSQNEDEALSFIAELDDGLSTTLFRSNDVLVKNKS